MLIARFWRSGRLAPETTFLKPAYLGHLGGVRPEALINRAFRKSCPPALY